MNKSYGKCSYGYFNSIFTHSFWWVFTEYPFGKKERWRIGEQFNPCFLRFCENLFSFHQNRGCIVSPKIHRVSYRFLQPRAPVISFNTFRSNILPLQRCEKSHYDLLGLLLVMILDAQTIIVKTHWFFLYSKVSQKIGFFVRKH